MSFLRKLLKAPRTTPKAMLFLELGVIPLREIIRERRLGFLYYILKENPKSMIHRFFQSQMKNPNKKDWVTTILDDLKHLGVNKTMEDIRNMKKGTYMNMIKQRIQTITFENLVKVKLTHSKVKNVEHNGINMQKYLQPNSELISREEAQLIFKLRCRVSKLKVNMKGKYDSLECTACGKSEESQEHILDCAVLNEDKSLENCKYDKIFNGTVSEKLKVARRFKENFDILENMKK